MHDAYLWVSFLHQLAGVAWLGWLLVVPWWLPAAFTNGDAAARAKLRKRATWLAPLFLGGGLLLAWGSGWLMARVLSPDAFEFYWLRTGSTLALAVTAGWLGGLLPWFRALARAGNGDAPGRQALAWKLGAWLTAGLGVAVLWLMTVRPL